MFQTLRDLIEKNFISLQDIVFVDFSETLERTIDFNRILENYYELFPQGTPFFVFDEIQEVDNFRAGVLSLFNRGFKIFLSGSNSNMLSSELSTQFRGRMYEYFIHPLSFSEFLRFRSFEVKPAYSTMEYGMLKNLFGEYTTYGGYPEIVLVESLVIKENLIKNYLNILIYRDLMERYRIENEYAVKYLIKSLILSNTKEINLSKIFNELKSQNVRISKNTLYNYLEYLENIFFIKKLTNYYAPKGFYKTYLFDVSYTFLYKNHTDYGKSFENIIFFEIQRSG
jgi:predicted AAA+ superfamily ATPase